jgi:hypothetical protein
VLTSFAEGSGLIGEGITGKVRLDVASGATRWHFDFTVGDETQAFQSNPCAIAEHADRLYCADAFGRLEERDLSSGTLIRDIDAQNGSAGSLWITRGGTELVSFGGAALIVSRWRIDGSGLISNRVGGGYIPSSYSPDGKLLIAWHVTAPFGPRSDPAVLDPADGRPVDPLDPLDPWTFAAWATPRSLIGGEVKSGQIRTLDSYDLDSPTADAASLTISEPDVGAIFESKHRLWVVVRTGYASEVWTIDKDTMQRIAQTLHVLGFNSGSGIDDGSRVVFSADEGVIIFDGQTGSRLGVIEGEVYNGTSTFSGVTVVPGGRLITASFQGELTVFDLETREVISNLSGSRGFAKVATSEDGSLAVATGQDHSVTLYDVASGEQIGDRLIIPDDEIVASALRPDGKELAIGGSVGQEFLVWDLDPEHWVTAACELAGRNLTPDEWDTYMGDFGEYHPTCPAHE